MDRLSRPAQKTVVPAHIPLDFTAKASIAVGLDGLLLGRRLAWPQPPGLWWCSIATGAVRRWRTRPWPPGKPASKQKPRQRQRSMPGSSISQSATASARWNVAIHGHGHARQGPRAIEQKQPRRLTVRSFTTDPSRLRSSPTSGRTHLGAPSVSGADQPAASTKRAKLIAMLERPEGASVAEIGQRLGWLPHTVRAAITGLRRAGREVRRGKDADHRSVYRLAPVEPASQR